MRIIKGKFNRRLIHVPTGLPVRPTTDLAKESLFNILNNRIDFEGLIALDLFSGTGNIAYELVSRGCKSVTAVDQDSRCVQFINKTAEHFGMPELKTVRADVFRFLSMQRIKYDLVFADPPYEFEQKMYEDLVQLTINKELLQQEGILIIEHSRGIDLSGMPHFSEIRNYGKVNFSFFSKE